MKKLLVVLLLCGFAYGSKSQEKMFWDEVKDTNDIELLKLYKKRYPNGTFESLADIKIKRLKKAQLSESTKEVIPDWLKGYTTDYKYYGVGKANKHFKGEVYQRTLATKRAQRELDDKFKHYKLTEEKINEYSEYIGTKEYMDENGRIYILLYIDDENL